ncbi:SPOR domain-containing protein [Orbus wheelerorum]|uniref:SPOR domain-containing protein n=1 Tax=Orbus wheelerorum TaxID=3074111 RepID=UPI00370D0CFB
MNESIRPEKEDRYTVDSSVKKTLSPKLNGPILSKKKWIILILALCVILMLLSFAIFSPASKEQLQTTSDVTDSTASNTSVQSNEYQSLTPPKISRSATETKQENSATKERLEVPGEVTDILADKISELNDKNQASDSILLEGKNNNIDKEINEQPLQKKLANDHYTIQINSSSSLESMMAFVKQHKLTNYQIYETRRSQKPWYVLIKGDYATIKDAKNAAKLLPQELQKSKPWIKSGEIVNKEKSSK